jgi:hypothetical protein
MNETMFPRQHLPRGNCSPIVHQQIVSSPVQILPDQFDSEKSTFHDAILLFFFFFFFFFWRNKPIKILLIAPDDGRERSSPRENL